MMTDTFSRTFSSSIDEVLNYAARFGKRNGFIIVVLDHLSDEQNYIAHLTSHLHPILKRNVRATDTMIRFAQDAWVICLDDCNSNFLEWSEFVLKSVLQRHKCHDPTNNETLICVHGTFLNSDTLLQVTREIEHEIEFAKDSLRRLKKMRSTALATNNYPAKGEVNYIPIINQAIMDNRVFIAFQPVVESHSRAHSHYECLARVTDNGGQLIPATLFISQCEKSGLVQLLDQRIQQLAIEELMGNRNLRLAINVSPITASDTTWLNMLKTQISARPDLKGRLMIELTETSVFQDIEESVQFISQLRDLGCPVSIDDFGAGYMSLTHLKSNLIQTVKIDAQFVKKLKTDPHNIHFIRAIIALTLSHGIKCIAEGVEDEETAQILTQEKVEFLQGYHINKPSPIRNWI